MLEFMAVDTHYGDLHVLKAVDYRIEAGEIVCLLGGNASGKSTTMKAIMGVVRPTRGDILFEGNSLLGVSSAERVRRGIAPVLEARRLFPRMTVYENLEMGAYTRPRGPDFDADLERVFTLFPRVKERLAQLAGTLSGGEQQMVAIGRALMARPRLLCMDEPSMGLSPAYVEQVFDIIRTINRQGDDDLHGRAERQHGAVDRRPRLCPADRPGRAERTRRRTAPNRADPPRLSGRTPGAIGQSAGAATARYVAKLGVAQD